MPPKYRVEYNRVSLLFSFVFLVEVASIGFKAYFSEPSPFSRDENALEFLSNEHLYALNSTSESSYLTWFQSHYNATTLENSSTYTYDSIYRIDVVRKIFPLADPSLPDSKVAELPCSLFMPAAIQQDFLRAIRGEVPGNASARVWPHFTVGIVHGLGAIWFEPGDTNQNISTSYQTVYCLFAPARFAKWWELAKWLHRLIFFVGSFIIAWIKYYRHVLELKQSLGRYHISSSAPDDIVRYEIVVGDPTSILAAHPFVCMLLIADYWINPEHAGQGCQRIAQGSNLYFFCLGVFYFSRCVWMGYGLLCFFNIVLKQFRLRCSFHALSPTTLEVTSILYTGIISHLSLTWYPFLIAYGPLMDVRGSLPSTDYALGFLLYTSLQAILPVIIGLIRRFSRISQRVSSRILSNKIAASKTPQHKTKNKCPISFNDFKHRIVLMCIESYRQELKHLYLMGGSIYTLFRKEPHLQHQVTLTQRGGDCYILGYNSNDLIVCIYRVSLASRIDLHVHHKPVRTEASTQYAVGTINLLPQTPTSTVIASFQPGQSPWIE